MSSKEPGKSPDRFDRLLAALRPGLKEDELAKVIAALVSSTQKQSKLDSVQDTVQSCLTGLDEKRVHKLVAHYLKNPPQEVYEELGANAEQESSSETKEKQNAAASPRHHNCFTPDLPIGSPLEELLAQLKTPIARQTLEQITYEEQMRFRSLMSQVYNRDGGEDTQVLSDVKDLLGAHGLEIRFATRPPVLEPTSQGVSTDGSVSEMDPVEFSKRAAKEESLGPSAARAEAQNDPYPDLMTPDPLLDSRDVMDFPPTKESPYHNRVIVRNHSSIFHEAMEQQGFDFANESWKPTTTDETEEQLTSTDNLPLSPSELRKLYRFPIFTRRITQQTGKGKIHRQFVLMIVGNGDGLVGLGQGKDTDHARAESKAFVEAVRNMDWVERFEKRTIWTEMDTKLGATRLIMRPRPVGFGLRCNPGLHQVLKAAGIKDISAKVWGSRNKINVIKAAMRMLQAGHAPLAMGDGMGGPGRKLNKGSGLRSKSDVERERGRKLLSLRK